MAHSFGNMTWLFRIQEAWLPFPHSTKTAMTRTDIAAKHERSCAIGPTLKNVGTTRFLTNRVQIEPFNQLEHIILIGWVAETYAKPFRLGLTDLLIVADYTEFAGQLFTSGGILRALSWKRKTHWAFL